MTIRLLFLINLLIFFKSASATVINVPASFGTISSALNSASAGDTILVAPGTYIENINWPQTPGLKLLSVSGPSNTIIDGNGLGHVLRIVSWSIVLDSTTLVSGFQIVNGFINANYAFGAGIFIEDASPVLRYLDVHNNVLNSNSWAFGSGIYCDGSSSPLIIDCNVFNNSVNSYSWAYGGGIHFDSQSSGRIENCNIYNNEVISSSWGNGGGISMDDANVIVESSNIYNNRILSSSWAAGGGIDIGTEANAEILNCNITGNVINGSYSNGGGIATHYSSVFVIDGCLIDINISFGTFSQSGAGIDCSENRGTISNSIVTNNTQYGSSAFHGAGLCADQSNLTILNSKFKFNKVIPDSTISSGIYGVGICCKNSSTITLKNSVVAANSLVARIIYNYEGCGVYSSQTSLNIFNSTITENEYINDSTHFGSAFYVTAGSMIMKNSICWNTRCLNDLVLSGITPAISYCDIRSFSTSNGNIDSDPLFVGSYDYHLSPSSPCIGSGILLGSISTDLDGNARPMPAGTIPDIGAYEIDQLVGIDDKNFSFSRISISPNPIKSSSKISFSDTNDEITELRIYSDLGVLIANFKNVNSSSFTIGENQLPSGIYTVLVYSRLGKVQNGKFVVAK